MSYYDKIDLKKDSKKDPKKELLKNLTEFNKDKKQWLESPNKSKYFNAIYFIHAKIGSEDVFALSKFCAHKNMTVKKYIEAARRNTPNGEKADKKKLYGGNKTRERIEEIMDITNEDWITFERLPPNEQESFSSWIGYFFPDKDKEEKAKSVKSVKKKAKFITISDNEDYFPEELNDELQDFEPSDFPPIEEVEAEYVMLNVLDSADSPIGRRSNSVRKVDHVRQSKKFKQIGDRGEQIVIQSERAYLRKKGRHDLAEKVVHISKTDDGAGYDILSFEVDGTEKYIEVKSTLKPIGSSQIFLTANEMKVAQEKSNYNFYIVYDVGKLKPKIWKIKPDNLLNNKNVEIKPILYKLNFKTKTNS